MGISLILPNADFSQNNIGTVHFEKSPAEKIAEYVSNYAIAIGTTAYNEAITALFTSLVETGLDTKLFTLYPMLGDTLAKQKVNALNPGVKDLYLNSYQASVVNNVLTFDKIGVGDCSTYATPITDSNDFSMFMVYNLEGSNSSSIGCPFACYNQSAGRYSGLSHSFSAGSNTPSNVKIYNNTNSSSFGDPAFESDAFSPNNQINTIYFCQKVTQALEGVNVVQTGKFNNSSDYTNTVNFTTDTEELARPNTILGFLYYKSSVKDSVPGESQSGSSSYFFKGNFHFYAIGNLSMEENATLKTIAGTFLNDVKNIEIV